MRTRRATKGAGTLWRKSMRVGDPANASTMTGFESDSDLSGFSCSEVEDADAWGCGAGPCCILGCVQPTVVVRLCRSVSEDNVDSLADFLSRTSEDPDRRPLDHARLRRDGTSSPSRRADRSLPRVDRRIALSIVTLPRSLRRFPSHPSRALRFPVFRIRSTPMGCHPLCWHREGWLFQ